MRQEHPPILNVLPSRLHHLQIPRFVIVEELIFYIAQFYHPFSLSAGPITHRSIEKMHNIFYLLILFSASAAATSLSSSSNAPLTTSILFLPERPGSLDASVINVDSNGTTFGLSCPSVNPKPKLAKRRDASSRSSFHTNRCAFIDPKATFTITEGGSGLPTTTIDFASYTTGSFTSALVTIGAVSVHCEFQSTTAGTCTSSNGAPVTVKGPDFTLTTDALGTSTTPVTTTYGSKNISIVQLVVTAGQQKLISASSASSESSSESIVTSSASPKPTSNAAAYSTVGTGMTGVVMAGILGFAIAA